MKQMIATRKDISPEASRQRKYCFKGLNINSVGAASGVDDVLT